MRSRGSESSPGATTRENRDCESSAAPRHVRRGQSCGALLLWSRRAAYLARRNSQAEAQSNEVPLPETPYEPAGQTDRRLRRRPPPFGTDTSATRAAADRGTGRRSALQAPLGAHRDAGEAIVEIDQACSAAAAATSQCSSDATEGPRRLLDVSSNYEGILTWMITY